MSVLLSESISFYNEACKVIPEGVSSPGRKFSEVSIPPIYVDRAEGAHIFDVDGNRYIDFVNGLGPVILGHSNPKVCEAMEAQLKKGTIYGLSCESEIKLARLITRSCKSIEQIRFVCSGTEAVMSGVRLAKHNSTKQKILKFKGSYHGHADCVLGNSIKVKDIKIAGVDKQIHSNTIMCEYNDLTEFNELIEEHVDQLAAVIIEPYSSNMGLVSPDKGFIDSVYKSCKNNDIILIFDEVVTGFRMRYGSVAEEFNVDPDITIFGKIIGGGTPIGAYGGKKHIMQALEKDDVFQGGTFAANPLSMVAAVATLEVLNNQDVYKHINYLGELLASRLNEIFKKRNLNYYADNAGSLVSFVFCNNSFRMRNLKDNLSQNRELFSELYGFLITKGLMLAPTIDEPIFISYSHTKKHIEELASAVDEFFCQY